MRITGAACRLLPLLLLGACATHPPILPEQGSAVELRNTPFFAQKRYQCGPAALAMVLNASGVKVTPHALVPKVYIPKRKGSLQAEMVAAARGYDRLPYVIRPRLNALLAEINAGHPVLILENLGWDFYPVWHYAVVIGTLPASDQMLLRSGTVRRKRVDTDDFLQAWDKARDWGFTLLRPGQLPAGNDADSYLTSAAAMESLGHTEDAAKAYIAATRRWPDSAVAWVGVGNTRYKLGNLAGAEAALRTALAKQPDAVVARNNLAQVLLDRGCADRAHRQIERALATAPADLKPAVAHTRDEIERRLAKSPQAAQACDK